MKRATGWAALGLAAASLLFGCKGFWNAPSGGGGNTAASGVFYVANQQTSQVAGFSFASGSTTPAAVTNSPYPLAAPPVAMAVSPNGSFLYVTTSGAATFVFAIGSGGALTALDSGQAISGDLATTMAVDSTGTWLLLGSPGATGSNAILHAIPVTASTGLIDSTRTEQTAVLKGPVVQQIAASPQGVATPFIAVAMGTAGTGILPFSAGNSNPFPNITTYAVKNSSGGSANAIAVDPSNRLVYVGETAAIAASSSNAQTGGLRVFSIGSGAALTEVTGSPYPTAGLGPSAILATSNFVYVANRAVSGSGSGNITGYPVSSVGGSYSLGTLVNTVSAGTSTAGIAEDSTKTYILAVNTGGPDLSTFTFDTTGKLTAAGTAATGTDPAQAVAIAAVQ